MTTNLAFDRFYEWPFASFELAMRDKSYCVYIIANERHSVLYAGVTGDLKKRIWQHRQKVAAGFASRYAAFKLVYYESCAEPLRAIEREKQIKCGSRRSKIELINRMNPAWEDLYDTL